MSQSNDASRLDAADICRIEDLADASGLSIEEVEDLVDNGVIIPLEEAAQPRYFKVRYVLTVKCARRLRDDFELDRGGVALALTLLRRIADLESELRQIRARQVRPGQN